MFIYIVYTYTQGFSGGCILLGVQTKSMTVVPIGVSKHFTFSSRLFETVMIQYKAEMYLNEDERQIIKDDDRQIIEDDDFMVNGSTF